MQCATKIRPNPSTLPARARPVLLAQSLPPRSLGRSRSGVDARSWPRTSSSWSLRAV